MRAGAASLRAEILSSLAVLAVAAAWSKEPADPGAAGGGSFLLFPASVGATKLANGSCFGWFAAILTGADSRDAMDDG